MKIKDFINSVKGSLGLDDLKKAGKKKSIKSLLKKLYAQKEKIQKALNKRSDKKKKNELEEELTIITFQIKKGEKILDRLNA